MLFPKLEVVLFASVQVILFAFVLFLVSDEAFQAFRRCYKIAAMIKDGHHVSSTVS